MAIAALREILIESPNNGGALNELALALHDYSTLLYFRNRKEESKTAHLEAFDIRKKLFQRASYIPGHRTFLARSYSSQGYYDRAEGNHESSIAQYQAAADLLRPLLEKSPDVYEYHLDLVNTMINQLKSCMAANNLKQGRPLFEQVFIRLTVAVQRFPKDQTILSLSTPWQHHWAVFLWEEGQANYAHVVEKQSIAASLALLTLKPQMTPNEEARLANHLAWQISVAPMPELRDPKKGIELSRRSAS